MAAKNQIAVTKQAAGASRAMDRVKLFWAGRSTQQRVYLGLGLVITLWALRLFL